MLLRSPRSRDVANIFERFTDTRDAPGRAHPSGSRIIGSQRKVISAKFFDLHTKVARPTTQIFLYVPGVRDAEISGRTRHQLGKADGTFRRPGKGLVTAFLPNQRIEEPHRNMLLAGHGRDQWKVLRTAKLGCRRKIPTRPVSGVSAAIK